MQLPTLDTLLLGNQFVGIELFSINGEDAVAQVFVEKKKGELFISGKEMRANYDLFKTKPNKDIPVFLTINNSQIIHKEVESIEPINTKLLYKAFPNIKTDEFYYEIWRLEFKSIVAICRKSYIEEIQNDYAEKSIIFSSISIGICGIAHIKGFVSEQYIKTNNQTISIENTDTILTQNENGLVKTYDINGLKVENTYLLSFTSVVQQILKSKATSGNNIDYNATLFENFRQQSFFKKGIKWMVYGLLLILLLNFFIFNYYFKKSSEINQNDLSNKTLIEKLRSAKERVKSKEAKLINSNNTFDSKSSFLINELVKNLPNSILLNEIIYHPIEKKIKDDEVIVFQSDVIIISGTTINPNNLTSWFEEIEQNKWIKKTTILHFGKNENNETVFTIKLNLETNEIK